MAVDYLSAVSHGVLSTGPANQLGICARFASWGLLTTAGTPSAAVGPVWRVVGSMFRGLINAVRWDR